MPKILKSLCWLLIVWSGLLSFWYFIGLFHGPEVWLSTAVALLAAWQISRRIKDESRSGAIEASSESSAPSTMSYDVPLLLLQGLPFFIVLILLLLGRTGEEVHSPWQVVPWGIFYLLIAGLLLRFALYDKLKRLELAYLLDGALLASLLFVVAIVFKNGFGFDPFLHEAAIKALVRDGVIHPFTPLYALYYAIIGALHDLTSISVERLNEWSIPTLALAVVGFGLPATLPSIDLKRRAYLLPLFFVLPFAIFTFSIPFHLAALICLFHLSWRAEAFESREAWTRHLALLLLACLAHPIPSLPILILFIGETIWRQISGRLSVAVTTISTLIAAATLPLVLILSGKASIIPDIALGNYYGIWLRCASLFIDPYRITYLPIAWWLELLYDTRRIVTLILPVALLALMPLKPADKRYGAALLTTGLLACFGLVQLTYGNIISYEHFEFALRLLTFTELGLIFLCLPNLPILKAVWRKILLAVTCTLLVLTSWYFSYPAFDMKNFFTAPAVSDEDLSTVRAIETDAHGEPYIVLSHQMLAAGALRVYGFRELTDDDGEQVLWYPIPTGGKLYGYFTSYINKPSDEIINRAADFMNVQRVYVVLHDSWPKVDEIRDAASATHGELLHTGIGGRSIMLYTMSK